MSYFPTGDTIIAREGYSGYAPQGGVLDTIGNLVKSGAGAVVDLYGSAQKSAGEAAAYKDVAAQKTSGGLPSWVLPAGIGVVGLAAVVLIARRSRKK